MLEFVLLVTVVFVCMVMQMIDGVLSQYGAISVIHGAVLGYGQVYIARLLLECGGAKLGWLAVAFIAATAVIISIYRIRNTWTRWIGAFNLGILLGIAYGAFDLV